MRHDVTLVGVGADGWDGLAEASRAALREAEVLLGGARQLALLPDACAGERVAWPSPLRPAVPALLAAHAGRRIAVLASGDPLLPRHRPGPHRGAGRGRERLCGCCRTPRPSRTPARGWAGRRRTSTSSAPSDAPSPGSPPRCTRGGGCWSSARTPAPPARWPRCCAHAGSGPAGCGCSNSSAARASAPYGATAEDWPQPPGDPLNVIAVECRAGPGRRAAARRRTRAAGRGLRARRAADQAPRPGRDPRRAGARARRTAVGRRRRRGLDRHRVDARPPRVPRGARRTRPRSGPRASAATPSGSACPGCASSPARHPARWPGSARPTRCSSAAA